MKKITLLFLFFCIHANAEWIYLSKVKLSTNATATFWYDIFKKNDGDVWVWERVKYSEIDAYGTLSVQNFTKINCYENSYQILSKEYYKKENWSNVNFTISQPFDKKIINSNSIIAKLANIVCNN